MQGMMMNRPLKIIDLLAYAAEAHRTAEVVSARVEGDLHRLTYPELFARAAQLAHGLAGLGIGDGDRVATLAWNGHRHLELYYAVSGMGAVCHTINPRLAAEQMLYILHHAGDRVLCFDLTFLPALEAMADRLPVGLTLVALCAPADLPDSPLAPVAFETLLADRPDRFDWPEMDETAAAALCYTSGTTGHPKGALYSHRSTVLHAMSIALSVPRSLHEGARILPVVPMFHVNSWGLPYAATLVGASLVMPGPNLDGPSLFALMEDEAVTSGWGVPTVWLGLRAEMEARGTKPAALDQLVIGGAAAARPMIAFFEEQGIDVCHAWGMTEMSPVGTHGGLPQEMRAADADTRVTKKAKQGRRVFGIDLKIVDDGGSPLPHDGQAVGELYVRGNPVISGYFENAEATAAAFDAEGWFATGDVASIDPEGFLTIQDRSKDLVKSGGEWISSIDLENAAMGHPGVANCAVIAMPDETWGERPLIVVVPRDAAAPPTLQALHAVMEPHFARWQFPDAMALAPDLPLTATGKVSKLTLRQRLAEGSLDHAG